VNYEAEVFCDDVVW